MEEEGRGEGERNGGDKWVEEEGERGRMEFRESDTKRKMATALECKQNGYQANGEREEGTRG